MIVGVPAETYSGERRVALIPAMVPALARAGLETLVEPGAGAQAGYPDSAFEEQGARLAPDRTALFSSADVLVYVHGPDTGSAAGRADLELLRGAQVVIGLLDPLGAPEAARALAEKGITAFALELVPRISRAQPMDALSSMATIAGYKAALLAAGSLPKMYPMMITAAGTVTPARVFVVGAGVAGLQAIVTSRRLGAVVHAYDIRPVVKEQVESLGARFVELGLETEGGRGVRGVCPRHGRGVLSSPARGDGTGGGRERRGHHHGGGPRQESADADYRRDGLPHASGVYRGGLGRRRRRQLRADPAAGRRWRSMASPLRGR